MQPTRLQISIDTQLIIKRFERTTEGDVVSYAELDALIGRDVRGHAKGCTRTARKRLLKSQIHFECIPNVGFRRCNDTEKVHAGGGYIGKARRACKRGVAVTTSVANYDTMSKADQVQHNMQLSVFQTLRALSTPHKQKAIAEKVEQAQTQLSLSETLRAIGDAKAKPKANAMAATPQTIPMPQSV